MNKLTQEEKYIIEQKWTEMPFSWKYWKFFEDWIYKCKKCWQKLFDSSSKFESWCGWPSFDDFLEKSVKIQKDADWIRQEIVCSKCNWHLGHVFYWEGLNKKNTRHCVNSLSLDFEWK